MAYASVEEIVHILVDWLKMTNMVDPLQTRT